MGPLNRPVCILPLPLPRKSIRLKCFAARAEFCCPPATALLAATRMFRISFTYDSFDTPTWSIKGGAQLGPPSEMLSKRLGMTLSVSLWKNVTFSMESVLR